MGDDIVLKSKNLNQEKKKLNKISISSKCHSIILLNIVACIAVVTETLD